MIQPPKTGKFIKTSLDDRPISVTVVPDRTDKDGYMGCTDCVFKESKEKGAEGECRAHECSGLIWITEETYLLRKLLGNV